MIIDIEQGSKVKNLGWHWVVFTGTLILLSACETVIDIDPPDYSSELSVVSKFSPDSVWSALITRTIPLGAIDDTSSIFLSDATVMIYEEDRLVDQLLYDGEEGWYVSSGLTKPQSNIRYRMVAEVPGYPPVSATSMAPAPPIISEINFSAQSSEIFDEDFEFEIEFRLEKSSSSERTYYSFSTFFGVLEDQFSSTSEYRIYTGFMYHDSPKWYCSYADVLNPFSVPIGDNYYCTIGVLSEQSFTDSVVDIKVRIGLPDFSTNPNGTVNPNPNVSLILYAMALSPEYVKYASSLDDYYTFDEFGEPSNPYTNMEGGGYGVFAGYSSSYSILNVTAFE